MKIDLQNYIIVNDKTISLYEVNNIKTSLSTCQLAKLLKMEINDVYKALHAIDFYEMPASCTFGDVIVKAVTDYNWVALCNNELMMEFTPYALWSALSINDDIFNIDCDFKLPSLEYFERYFINKPIINTKLEVLDQNYYKNEKIIISTDVMI